MEIQETSSRVVRVDSEDSWESLLAQANNQGCTVFVHFTASWCVPSLAMNSYTEELSTTYQYRNIQFLVVDVDEVKDVASKMEVKATPTFMLIKDGGVIDRWVGANPNEMKKRIDASLRPASILE